MNDLLYYNELFDIYGSLLTEKQQEYFKNYYFDNYTMDEIAKSDNISKSAVGKQIKQAKNSLEYYESKLHIKKRRDAIEKEFANEKNILSRISKYDTME